MPPRSGKQPNQCPDFLWVNRTPESDRLSASRQGREELRTITSHARTWRAALRRQQRLVAAQAGASHAQSIVGWSRPVGIPPSEPGSSDTSTAPSPSPNVPFSGDDRVPFAYLEGPEDAWWSHHAFEFATQTWLPSIFKGTEAFHSEPLPQGVIRSFVNRVIHGCLHNRMHMFSLLAASLGYLKFSLKADLDKTDAPEYCTGKALQYFRHYFAHDPRVDEFVIFDLLALSGLERYVRNFDGARTHLSMVRHTIEALGGWDSVSLPLRLLCLRWDLLVAAGSDQRPLMPLTWDPGSLPSRRMQEVQQGLLRVGVTPGGSALDQLALSTQSSIGDLVRDVVQWFQVQQLLDLDVSDENPDRLWASRRSHAIVHRLLSGTTTASPYDNPNTIIGTSENHLTECLRQALLLTISSISEARAVKVDMDPYSHGPEQGFAWHSSARLRDALSASLAHASSSLSSEAALWIACIGAQRTQQEHEAELAEWFVGAARRLALALSLGTGERLEDSLQRYTFNLSPDGMPNVAGLEQILN